MPPPTRDRLYRSDRGPAPPRSPRQPLRFLRGAEPSGKRGGKLASFPDIERFDALIGYLRSSGYFAIRPHLEKVPQIRLLVGINVDEIPQPHRLAERGW